MHSKAEEGQAKNEPLGFDVLERIADLKKPFITFCKP
jgi:hypothetical protein